MICIFHLFRMEKLCSKCNISKSVDLFSKDSKRKSGIRNYCKVCACIISQKYATENREVVLKRKAERRQNPEVKEQEKKRYKAYYHRPEVKSRYEEYRNNPEVKERLQEYFDRPDIIARKKELEKLNAPARNNKLKFRYKTDEAYHLTALIRSRIKKALSRNKTNSSFEYLGCDVEFLKMWLEFRFDETMTWENMGSVWHIDHILPIHAFDVTNPVDQYICFHWTNLQPLLANENLIKNAHLQLHHYFNNIVNVNRFNSKHTQFLGYQTVTESLQWLRIKLRYGKNPMDESIHIDEIGNPQPSL